MLCLTGLPLIFHEEIEHYFEPHPQLEPLHRRVAAHRLRRRDRPRPGRPAGRSGALPGIRKGRPAGPGDQRAEPGTAAGERPHAAVRRAPGNSSTHLPPPGGFMYLMLKLHTDLFLGLPGYLFLGLMGLPAGGLAGVRGGGIHAVHAQAGLRHGTRRTQPSPGSGWTCTTCWASSPCPGYWWSA
ncbi:PepSY domain-containing protein [Pseudomonas aeruginosa]